MGLVISVAAMLCKTCCSNTWCLFTKKGEFKKQTVNKFTNLILSVTYNVVLLRIYETNLVSCDLFCQEYTILGTYSPDLFLMIRGFLRHRIRKLHIEMQMCHESHITYFHLPLAWNSFNSCLQKCFHIMRIAQFSKGQKQFPYLFFFLFKMVKTR